MKTRHLILFTMATLIFNETIYAQKALTNDYRGSSFQEIVDVLNDESVPLTTSRQRDEFALYKQPTLPRYPMNAKSLFMQGSVALERDAIRTTSERFDYYDHLPKKLHPNGVCVTGTWTIDKQTPYSGYLASKAKGLFVGRISVAMQEVTKDHKRGFGIAGKIFPTMNEQEIVPTGNFFTVDVLMGTRAQRVLEVKTTNEPEMGFDFSLIGLGLKIASALIKGDDNPMFRPLTQVASLDNASAIKQPKWIRLSPSSHLKKNDESDFRAEIIRALAENKILTYEIAVSETTKDRESIKGWRSIGQLRIDRALVSYGCDRRLHFSHPKLK